MAAGVAIRATVPTAGAVTTELNRRRPSALRKGASSNRGAVSPVIPPEMAAFLTA